MPNPQLVVDIYTDAKKVSEGLDEATGKFGAFGDSMSKLAAPAAGVLGAIALIGGVALANSEQAQQAFGGLSDAWGDAAGALGDALLPAILPVIDALSDMAQFVQENAAVILPIIGVVAAFAAAILAVNGAMVVASAATAAWGTIQTVVSGITKAVTAAQWLLNAAMSANPVGIIIIAIIALVAAFIWLWNNVEGFRNFFIAIWDGIQVVVAAVVDWIVQAWTFAIAIITGVIQNYVSFFMAVWDGIVAVVGAVAGFFVDAWENAVSFVQDVFRNFSLGIQIIIAAVQTIVGTVANWFADVWESAVDTVSNIIKTLKQIFIDVFNAIMGPIKAVVGFFDDIAAAIRNVIDWLGRIKIPDVLGAIGGLLPGGQTAPAVAGFGSVSALSVYAGPASAAVAPRAVAGSSGGIVININGGLDSADTIARRVGDLLKRRDRRSGGIVLNRAER